MISRRPVQRMARHRRYFLGEDRSRDMLLPDASPLFHEGPADPTGDRSLAMLRMVLRNRERELGLDRRETG